MNGEHIPGGFILLARKTLESDLMTMTPLAVKLFFSMLLRANFKDRAKLRRGQLITSIEELREAGSFLVGYRKQKPSRDQIRSANEALAKASMITTAKTTRGMIVTVLNYDKYQEPKNYEALNESPDEMFTKPHYPPHDTEEGVRRGDKNKGTFAFSDETADAQLPLPGSTRQDVKAKRKPAGYGVRQLRDVAESLHKECEKRGDGPAQAAQAEAQAGEEAHHG